MPSDAEVQGTIRNLIRRLRFDHGEMTQQELAVRVGVTRQTIIALEAKSTSRRCCWPFVWHGPSE